MDGAAGEPTWSSPPPPELAMVARAVQRLVARNDALLRPGAAAAGRGWEWATTTMSNKGMAAFEAARGTPPPRIGVAKYLERMHRYAALEPECYVVAYAYVDRAAHRRPAAAVASRNVHRLLLACLLVASKVLDDFHHSNAFFARVGGVSNAEMNKLELELLVLLDFEVAVCHRAYDRYREHLEKEMLRDDGGAVAAAGTVKAIPRAAPGKPPVMPLTATVVAAAGAAKARPPAAPSCKPPLTAAVVASAAPPMPNGVPAMPPPSIRELLAVEY